MAETEISEVCYATESAETAEVVDVHAEQSAAVASDANCVIVGLIVDPSDTVTSSIPTSSQNYTIEGFADSSVPMEHIGDVPVKFELPENVCVGQIAEPQFAIFDSTPETTIATCIAEASHPTYTLNNFAHSDVKIEPVDQNGPGQIFRGGDDLGNVVFTGEMEVGRGIVSNEPLVAIPVTVTGVDPFAVADTNVVTSVCDEQFGVIQTTVSSEVVTESLSGIHVSEANAISSEQFVSIHTSEPSTISDEQFQAIGDGIVPNQEPGLANDGHFATVQDTGMPGTSAEAVENPAPETNGNVGFAVVKSEEGNGQLGVVTSPDGQLIPAEQFAAAVTDAGTVPVIAEQFQIVSSEQMESMGNAANDLTEEQITTLSTPEGLINVVQSLGDVQSVGDGQFTLVTPDGLLSVINPDSEQTVSTDGPINVTTENGIQYAILSTPEGLVKVALNAPEGIAAGVLVADENGQLVLQNVSGELESGGENAFVQLPVQFADQHDQAVLQANGLVVEPTLSTSDDGMTSMPATSIYAEAVSSGNNAGEPSMIQGQQLQEQPQIEPECFEVYAVEGSVAVDNQEQVMTSNPPEVEVVSYTTETAKAHGQPGPAGYALAEDSEPEFVSVEPPSITTFDENACVLCGKKFPLKEDLSLHLRLHARESVKTYDCTSCEAKFSRCWLLRKHNNTKHAGAGYSKAYCAECGEVFETKDRLCSHMWKLHKKRNAFPCNCLDTEFNTFFYLKRHENSKYCPVAAFFCNYCNENFASKEALNGHLEQSDERLESCDVNHEFHICHVCKRGFTNSRALGKHMESHKSADLVPVERLTCHKCGEHFDDHSALTEHTLRIHMKKKQVPETYEADYLDIDSGLSHTCNICGGRFETSRSLLDHLDAHIIGIIDRAGRRVKSPPVFHTSTGPKQCPYCKKDCHTLKRFNNHYCVRPGTDGRYPCQYCTKIFTNLSSVYSHLAWHRREEHQMITTDWPELPSENENGSSSSSSSGSGSESEEEDTGAYGRDTDTMFYTNKRGDCKCRVCGQKFRNTSSLQVHMATHKKKGTKRQRNKEEEAFRKKQRREKESFACEHCDRSFPSLLSLNGHIASHEKARSVNSFTPVLTKKKSGRSGEKKKLYQKDNSIYKCKVCDKVFVKFLSLCGHLATHRNDPNVANVASDSEEDNSDSMVIDFDSAISNFAKREKVRHSPVPRDNFHECNICGKVYSRLRSLSSHKKTHGDHAKLFACAKCGAKFSAQESLLLHKQGCRYEKQSCSCVKCGGKFPNFGKLKDHLPGCLGTGS